MEYSADHSAGVSPSTPPVATPAADTPDVGISASSSASDSGAPDYLGVGAVVGGDKLEAASICAQLGTPLDPKSIPVSAPHGTPPPAPGELLQDVQMAEQTTAAEDELKAAADVASESAVPHLVPDGPNAIVVDEPNSYTPAPNSAFTPNGVPFPAASDSTEDLPPPAKRARKNSGPTESSRLSPHFANGHVNGDTASSSTTPAPFTLSPAQHRFAVSTLKAMKKLKDAGPFLAPVDYVAFNIPHYPNIIKHPMDISTVERKLTASNPLKPQVGLERYNNVDEFAADVRLIFANCATFNGLEHPVTVMGKRVEAVFDKQMKQMPANEDIKPVVPKPAPPPPPPAPPKKVAPARRPSTSVPTIRRSDAADPPQGTSVRPKREIHPPPPKDLPYADAPKKGRLGRGGKRRRDDGTHEQLKFCSRLVNDLYKKQYYNIASPFYDPVDWQKLDLPTYPKIVKKPMDMSTIRKKLDTNEYTDAGQVHKDFTLMFNNCFEFNPRGNPVNTAGVELQAVFLDKWQSLPPLRPVRESEDEEEEESDDEQARTIAMMESQIETMRSSITALKKKPKKDRKSRHGGSSAPGSSKNGYNKSAKNGKKKHHYQRDDDVLTFEQKKALSEAIQTLEGLPLEKVISIIHEGVPEIRDSTEEIELDIDSLPATVLHKLYVEVLKPKPAKSHRGGLGARSISGGVKRKSMDEDAETEKIRLLEDKMKLFTSGGVSYGDGDDSGSASDSSSDSDSGSDGSDD